MIIKISKSDNIVIKAIKFIALSILVFIIIYSLINIGALSSKFSFFWKTKIKKESLESSVLPTNVNSQGLPQIADSKKSATSVGFGDNHLIIPKLGIDVSIIWDKPEDQILTNLLNGVVQYQGTAHPGEEGNVFITGHSSYYVWVRTPYKAIFSNLGKMAESDQIIITYNNKIYLYKVTNLKVVKPQDVSVLAGTKQKTLSLMTCVPIGTARSRLIVQAIQTNP